MFSFFSKNRKPSTAPAADMHSHLIPGIDDGVKTVEEALHVIDQLLGLGYTKLITTPHIMTDYYGNTGTSVSAAYQDFLPHLESKGYSRILECAAEYYMDDTLVELVSRKEPLLTFGTKHILFETNVISEPLNLKEFIFALTLQGYKPIMAHPERYQFMSVDKAEDLRNRGVLMQINMLSLIGYYGPPIQRMAEKLIQHGLVDALGSDCHNGDHALVLKNVFRTSAYRKAMELPLLNHTL